MPASSGLCSQARVRRPDGAAGHAVGFVASAGGVVALGDVLRGLPADLDAAVIVVLHLLPDHRSHLAEILARQTRLRVKEAGGRVLAQDESTAEFFAMPHAAIDAGLVDRVLPLAEIGPAVVDFVAAR